MLSAKRPRGDADGTWHAARAIGRALTSPLPARLPVCMSARAVVCQGCFWVFSVELFGSFRIGQSIIRLFPEISYTVGVRRSLIFMTKTLHFITFSIRASVFSCFMEDNQFCLTFPAFHYSCEVAVRLGTQTYKKWCWCRHKRLCRICEFATWASICDPAKLESA